MSSFPGLGVSNCMLGGALEMFGETLEVRVVAK